MPEYSEQDLEAFLDEALPADLMAEIERHVRDDSALAGRLSAINSRRDAGVHSLGEIWRRARVSCPSREQLGSFLLGALDDDQEDFIRFHLEVYQCRFCQANAEDLREQVADRAPESETRRRRYFQSSIGHLQDE
ncbi:MAG: hypothetical protein KDA42_03610 [Planctomycetales bacterium]|nr:hypothetical protein [Planctomycetales bacterium]